MILPTDLWGTESCSDTGVFSVRIWWIAALALHTWTGKPLISSTRSSPISSVSTSIRAPVFFLSCREKDTWQNVLEELSPGSAKGTLNLTLGVDELDTAISEIGCHKQSSIICTYGRRDKGNPKQQLIQNSFSVFRLVFPQIWIKESIILFPWHSNWIMEDGKNNQGAINLLLPINEFIIHCRKEWFELYQDENHPIKNLHFKLSHPFYKKSKYSSLEGKEQLETSYFCCWCCLFV